MYWLLWQLVAAVFLMKWYHLVSRIFADLSQWKIELVFEFVAEKGIVAVEYVEFETELEVVVEIEVELWLLLRVPLLFLFLQNTLQNFGLDQLHHYFVVLLVLLQHKHKKHS
jgi:hypothetical protein